MEGSRTPRGCSGKNLSSMTRALSILSSCEPEPTSAIASVTRTSQLKRTVNASVYRIHQTEDGKRVKKRRPAPRAATGWRKGGAATARGSARIPLKNAFFTRDIDELTISEDMG